MNRTSYQALMDRIVRTELAEEATAFSLGGASLVDQQFAGYDVRVQNYAGRGEFEFMDATVSVLQFVGLLWGTYETFKKSREEFFGKSGQSDTSGLEVIWTHQLIEAGLAPEKARRIAATFTADLKECIEDSE